MANHWQTTTSCYYGSLHLDATIILANIIQKKGNPKPCNMLPVMLKKRHLGQRAFVGVRSFYHHLDIQSMLTHKSLTEMQHGL